MTSNASPTQQARLKQARHRQARMDGQIVGSSLSVDHQGIDYYQILPPEIVLHIFGFLTPGTLAHSVSPVCKAFHDYAQSSVFWKTVRYSLRGETVKSFSRFFQRQSKVLKLDLTLPDLYFLFGCFNFAIPESLSLRKLVIRGGYLHNFCYLMNDFSNLVALKLVDVSIDYSMHSRNDEGECQCDERCECGCSALMQIYRRFGNNLQKLTLVDVEDTFQNVNYLVMMSNTLRELKIRRFVMRNRHLISIADGCRNIEKFHFETDTPFSVIAENLTSLPLLKDLSVRYNFQFYSRLLIVHAEEQRIMIRDFFRQMTKLEKCQFDSTLEFTDKVLEDMAKYCTRLKFLRLLNLHHITNAGICSLISNMKSLTELHVMNCVGCENFVFKKTARRETMWCGKRELCAFDTNGV